MKYLLVFVVLFIGCNRHTGEQKFTSFYVADNLDSLNIIYDESFIDTGDYFSITLDSADVKLIAPFKPTIYKNEPKRINKNFFEGNTAIGDTSIYAALDSLLLGSNLSFVTKYIGVSINIFSSPSMHHYKILEKQNLKGAHPKEYYRLIVGDKYLYIDEDSNMVITDSAKVIQVLLHYALFEMQKQSDFYKTNKLK